MVEIISLGNCFGRVMVWVETRPPLGVVCASGVLGRMSGGKEMKLARFCLSPNIESREGACVSGAGGFPATDKGIQT